MSRPSSATKNQLIELVLLSLGSSHGGLKALRGVLGSDPRLAVLGSAVDLQPVWEVLEAQPDFSREAAIAALCFVKGHEERLGIQINMPAALEGLSPAERMIHANRCRPPRGEIEKILEGELRPVSGATAPVKALVPDEPRFTRRAIFGMTAGAIAALSLVFVIYTIGSSLTGDPDFKRLDAAEFAGDIPIGEARTWGTEVRAQLVDPSWLKQPVERRRRQMELALDRLSARNKTTLIVEDDQRRQRATAQMIGRGRKIQVRFY
jgi:hypothetical protein